MVEVDSVVLSALGSITFWIIWLGLGLPISIVHCECTITEKDAKESPGAVLFAALFLAVFWPVILLYHLFKAIVNIP